MIAVDIRAHAGPFALTAAFRAEAGITSVFGPSGAGKTTLLRAIAGLATPDAGAIAVADEILFDSERRIDVAPEHRRIGYVFQEARLFPHLSVRANLLYGYRRAPQRNVPLEDVVAALAIAPLLDRAPAALSGGERQRAALGRALLSQPRLLLMDEPFAGVDAARKGEIIALIRSIRRFVPGIIHVSHDLDETAALADHIVLVEAGRTIAEGAAADLLGDPTRPLAQRDDARVILDGAIADHQDTLSIVRAGAAALKLPRSALPVGAPVRLQVFARDVSIALTPPQAISVRNIIRAEIAAVHPRADAQALIALATEAGAINAIVTADAVAELALAPGRAVFALVKAVAVR